jgi:anti-sigma B factor antagonist
MKLNTLQQGSVTVIRLDGNLMGGPDASFINSKLHELVEAGKRYVVLDLAGVQLMNSSGLGLLIGSVSALKNAGGALKIANASRKIQTLIAITKLSGVLESYPSVESAVASFKK